MMDEFSVSPEDLLPPSLFNLITGKSDNKATEEDKKIFGELSKMTNHKHNEYILSTLTELSKNGVDVGNAIYEVKKRIGKENK